MPAPMTTTRAAPGCVLKRTSSSRRPRDDVTAGTSRVGGHSSGGVLAGTDAAYASGAHRVDDARPPQHLCAVIAPGGARERRDRLVGTRLRDDGLSRDGVPDVDRRRVVPFLVEEDAAGSGQLHRNERIEQAGRQTALDDKTLDARPGGERDIEMQWVPVACQLRERLDVLRGERPGPRRTRPDRRCLPGHLSTSSTPEPPTPDPCPLPSAVPTRRASASQEEGHPT